MAAGLVLASAAGLIAYGAMQSVASSYRATAVLSVLPESGDHGPTSDLRGAVYDSQRDATLGRHISGLRAQGSNQLLADALGVADPHASARHLDVAEHGDEQVAVTVAASDPGRAVAAVNVVVDGYQATLERATRVEKHALAVQKRQQEIVAAEGSLRRAEQDLTSISAAQPASSSALDDDIATLTEQVQLAERERQQNEARAAEIRAAIAQGRAEQYVSAQTSSLARQLVQVKAHITDQIAQMAKTLPPNHPRLQQLSADLSNADRQLAMQAVKSAEALDGATPALHQAEQRLKSKLKSLQHQRLRGAGDGAAKRGAERAVLAQRQAVEALRAATLPAEPPAIAVVAIERATTAVRVPNPNAQRFSLIAGALAFAVVAAAAILVALTRSRSR